MPARGRLWRGGGGSRTLCAAALPLRQPRPTRPPPAVLALTCVCGAAPQAAAQALLCANLCQSRRLLPPQAPAAQLGAHAGGAAVSVEVCC